MALHLVIDGYNLIGSDKGLRGNLEERRKELIRELQRYHERKSYPITVVFDGWRSGGVEEAEERWGNVTVIYSRLGEKADAVVARLARELGSQCVVVSSDREVKRAAEKAGAAAVGAGEFSPRLRREEASDRLEGEADDEEIMPRSHPKKGNPRRLSKSERRKRERLKKL